jgi:hypothetical protein
MEKDDTQMWITIALVGAAAYALYLMLQQVGKIGSGVASAVGAATNATTSSIANAWVSMTTTNMGGVLGNILFPDGNVIALAATPIKTLNGGVYVMEGGALYQLGQSDANGNWPASLVLTPPT